MQFTTYRMVTKDIKQGILALALPGLAAPVLALEDRQSVTINGILASAIQCRNFHTMAGNDHTCNTAVPVQFELASKPTELDEVFFKFSFAAGNGHNHDSPFELPTWAADLEDDLSNINGRNRSELLTAWYKRSLISTEKQQLSFTLGVIDSTDYLDGNAYANDEFTQFMHPALTNGPNVFLPSYDIGVALEWDAGSWSMRGVMMDVGENDDGNNYNFYGVQLAYSTSNRLGAGHYRALIASGSEDFLNPAGAQLEARTGVCLSLDQALGSMAGVWLRSGWQTDRAAVNYDAIYSAGVDLKGHAWGRAGDNIGLGVARLNGGNLTIEKSMIAEVYYRWQLGDVLGLSADIQYLRDDSTEGALTMQRTRGWNYSLRAVAEF